MLSHRFGSAGARGPSARQRQTTGGASAGSGSRVEAELRHHDAGASAKLAAEKKVTAHPGFHLSRVLLKVGAEL